MREQSKWRRIVVAVAIGVGLALVGAGVTSVSLNEGSWTAEGSWTNSVTATGSDTSAAPAGSVGYVASALMEGSWTL